MSAAVVELATLIPIANPHKWVSRACSETEDRARAAALVRDFDLLMEIKAGAEATHYRAVREALPQSVRLTAAKTLRRVERLIGQAIQDGQAAGQIRSTGQGKAKLPGPSELLGMPRSSVSQLYDMTPGTDTEFEQALADAERRGNLARVMVASILGGTPQQDDDWIPDPSDRSDEAAVRRRVLIKELAAQGQSSRQMQNTIGTTEIRIREVAREMGLEIPADKSVLRTKRPGASSSRIAEEAVSTLEALASAVELIDYDAIDPAQGKELGRSAAASLKVLSQFAKQIGSAAQ